MSRATKRKHVMNEALQDYFTPPSAKQEIVRIVSSRGNNLHEVETSTHSTYLASMPNKFRKNIWVKRGDFVIVEPIDEGDKVKAEMVRVLAKEHIKYFKKIDVWPEGFSTQFEPEHMPQHMDSLNFSSSSGSSDSDTEHSNVQSKDSSDGFSSDTDNEKK